MQTRTYAFQFQHIWHRFRITRHRVELTVIHALIPATGSIPAVRSRGAHTLTRQQASDRIRTLRILNAEPRLSGDFDQLFN